MIAARQIAFGGSAKKWENPYITDGLVAMWDGEWNAGWGKHDPSAINCVGLVGGFELAGNVLSPNSFCCTDNKVFNLDNAFTQFTIESIKKNGDPIGGGVYLCNGSNDRFSIDGVGESYGNCRVRYWNGSSVAAAYPYSKSVWGAVTVSFDGKNFQSHLNAVGRTPSAAVEEELNVIRIVAAKTVRLPFHSIRVYNRALTAEEIAYNYKIDKQRFGL